MKTIDVEFYQQVKSVVSQLWDAPKDQWPTLIEKLCQGNSVLQQEIQAFIAQEVDENFLSQNLLNVEITDQSESLKRIGRISIKSLIAEGGMGQVYAGFDEVLQRKVAVKIINSGLHLSSAHRQAFLNEAQVLSSIQHPNICQVYDFFQDDDRDVLVMELIEGQTLRQILDKSLVNNPMVIAIDMANALMTAHERGIVHRDLKPENIMLTADGSVKILDFGLALNASDNKASNIADVKSHMTAISGTPGYMAPEQARGEISTSAVDVWSFAVLLCELFTSDKPFPSAMNTAQLLKFSKQAGHQVPDGLSRAKTRLLNHMLSADAQDRPSARNTLNALEHIANQPKRLFRNAVAIGLMLVTFIGVWKYTTDLKAEQTLAKQAQLLAEQQKVAADKARLDAENLVSFMLNDLHTDLRALGQLNLLESVANQSLAYFDGLSDKQKTESQGQSAIALLRISEVLTDSGQNDQAILALEQALRIIQQTVDQQPNDPLVQYRLALIKYNLADLQKLAGDYLLSRKHLLDAVRIGEQLTAGLSPGLGPIEEPNATMRWTTLLRSEYLLADTYTRNGGGEQAYDILEKVVRIAVPAAKVNPQLTINLSDIQYKRCDTYFELQLWDEILYPCKEVLRMDLDLHHNDPENYELHKNLLGDYTFLANVYRRLQRYEEGLEAINQGLDYGDALVDRDSKNVNTKNEYVTLLLAKGRLLLAHEQIDQAQSVFQQAYDIIMPLIKDKEEITFMHNAFIATVYLGQLQKADSIGGSLTSRGFKRREFVEMCNEHQIKSCMVKP